MHIYYAVVAGTIVAILAAIAFRMAATLDQVRRKRDPEEKIWDQQQHLEPEEDLLPGHDRELREASSGIGPIRHQGPDHDRCRAENRKPQGYISQIEATAACNASGKRLCTLPEWMAACQGPQRFTYPYGNTYVDGACNEGRSGHPVIECFGSSPNPFTSSNMNSPCCLERPNTVEPGGTFAMCVSSWGI